MATMIGLLLAFLGGGIQGTFVYPLKLMKKWEWENGWLVFTITCCLIIPSTLAIATVPDLLDIYKSTELKVIVTVFLFGIAWGVGVVLFGLGARMLGMALGIAIITGLNACLGTLFPILFLPSNTFSLAAGGVLGLGLIVLVMGVIVVSIAGNRRDKEQTSDEASSTGATVPFKVGLMVCIVAAVFCPSTNFAVFFGQPISDQVKQLETVANHNVPYAQLLPFFIGGSLVNILYCIYLFKKNNSFKNYFIPGVASNWIKGVSMSVVFIVGMVLYTIASTNYIKDIGPIVGWPLFMSATILSSNVLGILSKEWQGVSKTTFITLYKGIGLLLLAILLAGLSNRFIPS